MKEKQFRAVTGFLRKTPERERAAIAVCKGLPIFLFLWYGAEAAFLLIQEDRRLPRYLLIPFSGFLVVSVLRNWLNLPRPYERYSYTPLFPEHHKGKSFPSRHTACAFLIAAAIAWSAERVGWLAVAAAVLVGGSRLAAGMHEPKDVLAGMAFGVIWCWGGFAVW